MASHNLKPNGFAQSQPQQLHTISAPTASHNLSPNGFTQSQGFIQSQPQWLHTISRLHTVSAPTASHSLKASLSLRPKDFTQHTQYTHTMMGLHGDREGVSSHWQEEEGENNNNNRMQSKLNTSNWLEITMKTQACWQKGQGLIW